MLSSVNCLALAPRTGISIIQTGTQACIGLALKLLSVNVVKPLMLQQMFHFTHLLLQPMHGSIDWRRWLFMMDETFIVKHGWRAAACTLQRGHTVVSQGSCSKVARSSCPRSLSAPGCDTW